MAWEYSALGNNDVYRVPELYCTYAIYKISFDKHKIYNTNSNVRRFVFCSSCYCSLFFICYYYFFFVQSGLIFSLKLPIVRFVFVHILSFMFIFFRTTFINHSWVEFLLHVVQLMNINGWCTSSCYLILRQWVNYSYFFVVYQWNKK